MISDVTHTLGQVPNQNFMLKKSSINLLLLLRAKPTKVVAHVCPISQLSDLNMTFSLVSSTCLSRKKRRRNKHILLTYQCSWNVCQIRSHFKPSLWRPRTFVSHKFCVFHVDIRLDVTWQNMLFTAPFSLMASLFQTIINSRIVIFFSLQLYKPSYGPVCFRINPKGRNLPPTRLTLSMNWMQNAHPRHVFLWTRRWNIHRRPHFLVLLWKAISSFRLFNFCPT